MKQNISFCSSDMSHEKYSVIECKDEIKLVPTKWIQQNEKECSFPNYEPLRYNRVVKNYEDPDPSWPKYPVVRIMSSAETYDKGRKDALKLQHRSENPTCAANANSSRKRMRKDSDSEDSEDGAFPDDNSNVKSRFLNGSVAIDLSKSYTSTGGKSFNKLFEIVEKLEFRIGKLQNSLDEIIRKLNSSESSYMYTPLQQLPQFPLITNEAVEDLEDKLLDMEFRKNLIAELRKLGGKRLTDIVNKQMSFLMDYSLGSTFSYYGTKEKRAFCVLKLCNVIADVVRLFFPNTTNEEMKEPIQTWLRHCKEKYLKKQKSEIFNL